MHKKRIFIACIVVLFVLLIMILVGVISFVRPERHPAQHPDATPGDRASQGTGPGAKAVKPDSAFNRRARTGSIEQPAVMKAQEKHRCRIPRTPDRDGVRRSDSLESSPEEAAGDMGEVEEGACVRDTIAPWVYTDPAGGLHHTAISVKLFATKPCVIEWKTDSAAPWKTYNGETIRIETTTALLMRAADSCGNKMEPREERYELRAGDTARFCPDDMEHVLVGATSFCIDRYEWPNVKGRLPRTYISVYQAMDTCVSAGKRLCTSDEWTIACAGPYGWKYPYGANYEIYACVTNDTTIRPSGTKPECRGYFGVFDMSGNCAEWTGTRSSRNMHYYNVMGGFWESGPQGGCFDVRYSYFPQNRHNPVGFRCCKDARSGASQRGAE
jgi:hypothetical protein